MLIVDNINDVEGKVISNENPYVKVLNKPKFINDKWEAIAQVEGMLCVIELTIKEIKQ